jgi:hypothetical protein
MPAFAFTYGSFGDVLATAQVVAKLVLLLRNGRRSVECAETEKELISLGADLANLTHMPVDDDLQSSPIALSVAARIQEEVKRCHLLILRFFQKINASQGLIHKLLWAVSEERELSEFRMRVVERRTALGVVVGMMNSYVMFLSAILFYMTGTHTRGMLLTIRHRVNEVGLGNRQIQDAAVSSLAHQLAIYQEQIVTIMRHVPHAISEETFVVISPAGVPIPIPLAYCRTYGVSCALSPFSAVIMSCYLRIYNEFSALTWVAADSDLVPIGS